jgi:hypothetical protein
MNNITLLIIALVAIVVITFIIYGLTSASAALNTLSYDMTTLYKGTKKPVFSSDGIERVVYLKDNGTWEYDTATGDTKILSDKIPKGLAYDGTYFMMLDQFGTLYQIDELGNVISTESGYTKLYDTIDGYLLATPESTSVTGSSGSTTKNTGNYGLVVLKVS